MGFWWLVFAVLLGGLSVLSWLLKNVNEWFYVGRLDYQKQHSLPPGDMGWPLIGKMWSFLISFKYHDPEAFIYTFITRYGRTGIYRTLMFGSPSVIVTMPETCRRVLMDDKQFKHGWPKSAHNLLGKKSFLGLTDEEHKRLRRLTAAPINGHKALAIYHDYITDAIVTSLDEWAKAEKPIEFLTQIRKLTFKIIMSIFLSGESALLTETLEEEYAKLNHGLRAMAINLPGFAYYKALKGRKNLVTILQSVVDGRKKRKRSGDELEKQKDMMDLLMEVEDENGAKLDDEEIIDVILMYLNAGHESTAHATLWATLYLHRHPEYLQKAKEEQEEIVRRRPSSQKGLSFGEIRQMKYLSKVIDETMRIANISLFTFREAKTDVSIGGFTIPKGWKVIVWFRGVHLDPECYPNPKEFDPSRWAEFKPKPGTYMPFGAGSRLCPGSDLSKLEMTIFLHHFLLNYELEQLSPGSAVKYLPHTKPMDNCMANIKKIPSALS
ncbi:Cytochrome P450 family ent-kaurenoic acid oxidase [Quillaja saponaria]|uniref:Cytochrome P450 family ent-kaurenoic acid oxidase n=1 Tax=Quillaja saponaria TaxID=32244 RepID=A0AAD7L712_QUISA|nr:Cytochrome P450 family ent-kaurenoic acid oxidase [Quillaja saponaria]